MEQIMRKTRISNPTVINKGMNAFASFEGSKGTDDKEVVIKELYQFYIHTDMVVQMWVLVLDAVACLCQEWYGNASETPTDLDLVELIPGDGASPTEITKDMLDAVLHSH